MGIMQVEVYECGNCAAPVKPHAEKCEYCGYYFVENAWIQPIVEVDDYIPPKVTFMKKYHIGIRIPSSLQTDASEITHIPIDHIEIATSSPAPRMFNTIGGRSYFVMMELSTTSGIFETITVDDRIPNLLRAIQYKDDMFDVVYIGDGDDRTQLEGCKIETVQIIHEHGYYKTKVLFRVLQVRAT